MKLCPDCRTPILSMMFIDAKLVPEFYCERCARSWPVNKAPAPEIRKPALV